MFILDTCAFFTQKHPEGKFITAAGIDSEIINKQSKQYFENMRSTKMEIMVPDVKYCEIIKKHAKETGDFDVLSKIDLDIIALGYELKGTIVTDDFAVQNVALSLGLKFVSCSDKIITEKRSWLYKCTACSHTDKKKGKDCPVCGNNEILRIKSK
mgnify:CR=1 FL=1